MPVIRDIHTAEKAWKSFESKIDLRVLSQNIIFKIFKHFPITDNINKTTQFNNIQNVHKI